MFCSQAHGSANSNQGVSGLGAPGTSTVGGEAACQGGGSSSFICRQERTLGWPCDCRLLTLQATSGRQSIQA